MPDAGLRVGGRYRLGRKLASGGMGAVWEGWDERLHRTIAIKRLHLEPWLSEDERHVGIQRAMREARLTARLHHPNVVQVFDIVDDANSPCLIMEYVPSRSLYEIVRERGPLPPHEVAGIGAEVAAGLAAAHAAGVVHRDVKPGNVLIADEGPAKVSDFGISHAFDDVTVTSTGLLVGTPAYLAPEVARGAPMSFASDVYGLGATLYMATEGKPPFGTDDNPMAVLHRVASGDWEQPVRSGPLTPVLTKMMALDPDARPTMAEAAAELRGERPEPVVPGGGLAPQSVLPGGATQVIPVRPPAAPSGPPLAPANQGSTRRRRPGLLPIATLLLGLVLIVVLAIVLLGGNGGGQPSGSVAANPPTGRAHTASRASSSAHTSGRASSAASSAGTSQVVHGQPSAQQLADAITNYFTVVPGDLHTGWNLLTPHFQTTKAQNWQTYRDYWDTVDHVVVRSVAGQPPHGASADLVYYYKNGQVVSARTTFTLLRQGGVLKIDSES